MPDRAFRNVAALRDAVRDGIFGLEYGPRFLRIALVEGTWRRFETPEGRRVEHNRFGEFVTSQPYEGLGITIEALRKIVGADNELVAMLNKTLEGKAVAKPRDYGRAVQQVLFVPSSRSMQRNLDRLREASKFVHARVMRGELSLYEGMIEVGLRDRTLTVRPADVDATARALRDRLTPSQLSHLKKLL